MDQKSLVELSDNPNIPDFRPGDTVRVHAKVIEGDRERTQAFEGVVIRVRHRGIGSTFTVRRVSHGVGVERTFPYHSPLIEKVQVMRVGRVRRAKLYYLRQRVGKAARIRAGARARFEELAAVRPQPAGAEEAAADEETEALAEEDVEAAKGEAQASAVEEEPEESEEEAETEEKVEEEGAEEEAAAETKGKRGKKDAEGEDKA